MKPILYPPRSADLLRCLTLVLVGFASAVAQTTDPYAPEPAVPPGYKLVGGDILVSITKSPLPESAFPTDPNRYWPGGIVPFQFHTNVTAANRTTMLNAMAQWENVANVDFIVRTGQADYVQIQNSTGNNSQIGRVGGQQLINIVSWGTPFILVHELGHCLGFGHTHTRPDRNTFVQININNVQIGTDGNFDVDPGFNGYGPYDFDSIMHYDQCSFSIDCPVGSTCACARHTIDVLPPNNTVWQSLIGQRTHLSTFDQLVMSFLYREDDWVFVDQTNTGPQPGIFLQPYATFAQGRTSVPTGGTVWLQPGTYATGTPVTKAMTIQAPLGGVTLSN